ncbi:MAG: hypothetical protein VST65_01605 [Nitrospirota bacterium]|nr:hypothetical protein [Nitrospirota bacterium]
MAIQLGKTSSDPKLAAPQCHTFGLEYRGIQSMSACLLNATYVANPIRAIHANAPYAGYCFRIQVQTYFRIGASRDSG